MANYFLERLSANANSSPQFDTRAIDRLLSHPWPGNVRELEHSVAAAAAMALDEVIHAADLQLPKPPEDEVAEPQLGALLDMPLTEAKTQLVESFERQAIARALERQGGNVSAAARQLGIHRQSLQQKMTQLGIRAERRS